MTLAFAPTLFVESYKLGTSSSSTVSNASKFSEPAAGPSRSGCAIKLSIVAVEGGRPEMVKVDSGLLRGAL